MVLLRNTCLNCSFLRQLGHLVTVSDPLTATSSSCRQLNCRHMDGVLLLHLDQLCGTASPNTPETQHYPLIRIGAILKHTFCSMLIYTRRLSALETLWLHALYKFFLLWLWLPSTTRLIIKFCLWYVKNCNVLVFLEHLCFIGLSHHVVSDNGSLQMLIDKGNGNR